MSGEFDLTTVQPASQLEAQLGTDETLEWVVEKQQQDVYLETVGSLIGGVITGIFFAVFAFVGVIALTQNPGLAIPIAIGVIVLIAVLSAVWTLVNGMMSTIQYAATDERFITLNDTLTETNTESVPIDRVRDVEYSEDFKDKIFGTGDISIEPERGADPLVFNNVKDEQALLQAVREQAHI
jgi:uncharacterized membrane protein YdbT with pleckstrin-like domain